jgi:hypothetical protein
MGMREKDSADFDLEAFIDLFDEALTSDDPSVQKTLQHLMVIAALARNHAKHDQRNGPLRRMFEDQNTILRRLERLEADNQNKRVYPGAPLGPGVYPPTPHIPGTPWPGTGGGTIWPPQPGTYPPGTIWAQTQTSTGTTLDPGFGAIPPMTATQVNDLLKDEKYKGSSLGTTNVKIP